MQQLLLLPSIC